MLRVFIAIGQTPFDPTSGAAQATLHMAVMLAQAGCTVHCLATSATEGEFTGPLPTGNLVHEGVVHQIMPVPAQAKHSWYHLIGKAYDACFARVLAEMQPELLITFGDEAPDRHRRALAAKAGVQVVFCLHNFHYRKQIPPSVNGFLAPSEFLASAYRRAWPSSPDITVLPTPILPSQVVADHREPVFVTFINPQPAKGLWFMVRLAELLAQQHPEIPLRIVEGRASAADFLLAAERMDVDLRGAPNLFFSPCLADVREIWSTTRILLAPSVWEEPAGRVAVEAMLNGAVPIVSDRGGLSEQVGAGGLVLPLPESLTPSSRHLPSTEAVQAWIDALLPLCRNEGAYEKASQRARKRAALVTPVQLIPRYLNYLRKLLAADDMAATPLE